MSGTNRGAIRIGPQRHEPELALAITRGFLAAGRRARQLRASYWRNCEAVCVPYVEVRLTRKVAYFLWEADTTDSDSSGYAELTSAEADRLRELLIGAFTRGGCLGSSRTRAAGGPFVQEKLFAVMLEIAGLARRVGERFQAAHPNRGAEPWCPHRPAVGEVNHDGE